MVRTVAICVVMAGLGAAGALVLSHTDASPAAVAADPVPQSNPVPPNAGDRFTRREPQPAAETSQLRQPSAEGDYTPEERINIRVYEDANRSVVHITTKVDRSGGLFFFDVPNESSGSGSGSVLDRRGYVLTNYHVVEGAREIHVLLYDGKSYDARLVGFDATTDTAVLKIDAPEESLVPVRFGDSSNLKVGQRVYAIGNPFGLERTLATGIVSSLDRSIRARNGRTIKSIIQIDAAINPGNSGGPLLDSRSRLIGMNTAIATKTGQSAGVGFAIPVGTIARVVPQLIENGKVIRPEIGITRVMVTENGLLIATLAEGGPAERAGLQGFKVIRERRRVGAFIEESMRIDRSSADLIVAVDGERFKSAEDFLHLVEQRKPGDVVKLTVVRGDGSKAEIPVRLTEE